MGVHMCVRVGVGVEEWCGCVCTHTSSLRTLRVRHVRTVNSRWPKPKTANSIVLSSVRQSPLAPQVPGHRKR